MTDQFWIADVNGVKACVDSAAEADEWTRVRGWSKADAPTGLEFQWVRNVDHGGRGVMNHEAALLHEGLGWVPSGPPAPDVAAGAENTPAYDESYPVAGSPTQFSSAPQSTATPAKSADGGVPETE